MTKIEFQFHLAGASILAYRFAKNYLTNNLPIKFKYNVVLNGSSDDPGLKQFDVYPDDNGIIKNSLTEAEVVDLLFRKDKVPVWIDINVCESNKEETIFNLLCAGRYSNNKDEFYYNHNGSGPFGVKSPILPVNFVEGNKFKI